MVRMLGVLVGVAALVAAEAVDEGVPTPGPGDRRVAIFAREHVQIELFAPMGAKEARAVLTNRDDQAVLVCYTVENGLGNPVAYEADLLAGEVRGGDGRYVVATGGSPAPRVVITSVDILPVEEASGYVLLDDDFLDRVSVRLYLPVTGGKRAFAVLANADNRKVRVDWEAIGLIDGPSPRFQTDLAAHAIAGKDGTMRLVYHPPVDPRHRTRVRVKIHEVRVIRD